MVARVRDAPIRHWLITQTNIKSYKNLMFLPFDIEKKLLIMIPALQIIVKPALG